MQITPQELKDKLAKKGDLLLLDVRTPEEYANWKIEGSVNIPIQELTSKVEDLPKKEIITICAHGQRSQFAANMLNSYGFKAASLWGGMALWNTVYDFVELAKTSAFSLYQIKRVAKGCLGYFLISAKKAVIVDPTTHVSEYTNFAKNLGCKIEKIVDTHQHADHLSGSRLLRQETKAELFLNSLDGYNFSGYKKLEENKSFRVGEADIQIIQTPGHTKGSTSLLVDNKILLTGDTLFVEGVARPDIKNKSEEYAADLHETYQNKILNLSPNTLIASAHSRNAAIFGQPVSATLESIRKSNRIFELSKTEFVKYIVSNIPHKPFNYEHIIKANKEGLDYSEDEIAELEFGANKCVLSANAF